MSPRTRLLLALLRAGVTAAGAIPRYSAEPFCRLAGAAWYLAARASRQAVRANLRHILGRDPTVVEVRRVFEQGALNYWDTLAIPQLAREELIRLVDIEGWDHVDAALAAGKGYILAGAHLGSVALAGQVVAARGYPLTGVVESIDPPELFDFLTTLRASKGIRLLPAGPSVVRDLMQALRRNEGLALITDRDVLGTGPMVRFFDALARFPEGPAALSLRTGAPILVAVAVRRPDGSFRGWIEPPLHDGDATGNFKQDVARLTQALATRLQYHIAGNPEQWTVFQKRWPDNDVRVRRV